MYGLRLLYGSWNTSWARRRNASRPRPFERADVRAVEQDAAGGDGHQTQRRTAQGGLAAARFAHDREVLAALQGQRDVPDGAHGRLTRRSRGGR